MPAVPLFLHHLAHGILALEALPEGVVDRKTLEEALGVGKWTAWRIMKRCGASPGPGGALVCRRDELVFQLRRIAEDPHFAPEIQRRERLSAYLDRILRDSTRRHKEITRNQAAADLLSSRFASLPPGVDLSPGELRITFSGTAEFLQKFGAVVFALQNDYEKIAEFIDHWQRISPPNLRADLVNPREPA